MLFFLILLNELFTFTFNFNIHFEIWSSYYLFIYLKVQIFCFQIISFQFQVFVPNLVWGRQDIMTDKAESLSQSRYLHIGTVRCTLYKQTFSSHHLHFIGSETDEVAFSTLLRLHLVPVSVQFLSSHLSLLPWSHIQ